MGILTTGEQLASMAQVLRTTRGALGELAGSTALADDAAAAIAVGGRDAVTALERATSPGATLLRDAWHGADELRRGLPILAARLEGEHRAAATMAAAHADGAAELLDGVVFSGTIDGASQQLRAHAAVQLERLGGRLDDIVIETPRTPRAWERAWLEGR